MLWMRTQMISNVPYFIILEDIQHISALSTWPRGPHRFSAPMGEQTFARTSHISDLRVMPPSLPWKKYQFIDSCPINNIKTSIFTEDFHDKLIQITYESRWSTYIISWKIAIIFHGGIHAARHASSQLQANGGLTKGQPWWYHCLSTKGTAKFLANFRPEIMDDTPKYHQISIVL